MIDGSLTFQKHIKRWTRITQKYSKQGDDYIMSYDGIYPQQAKKTL